LVIDLTREEKKALFQFLSLYLGSLFVLFAIIAYLFYTLEYSFYQDKTKYQMQMKASSMSSKIIHAHMGGKALSLEKLSKESPFDIGFYDKNKKPIVDISDNKIDFQKVFYENQKQLILVDKSAFGHLGVVYTVIKEHTFFQKIAEIKNRIIISLLVVYLLIFVIGYFLAKLFIKPIQMKRVELNNFIKDSTHELNTPISALLMSLKPQEQMDKKSYDRIKISAKRISDIYKDLTYLFLENTQPEIKTPLSINNTIKEQVEHLTPLADKKRITIEQTYEDEILFNIEKENLIRLITNLLSNAIKYNTLDVKIEIKIKERTLMIKDNGIGIDKKHKNHVCKRFYRATTESGGFGLGLNIVYKICQTYDIKLELESKKGKGTIFWLTF